MTSCRQKTIEKCDFGNATCSSTSLSLPHEAFCSSVLFPFFPYLKMRTFFRGCSLLWKSLWIMSLLIKSTFLIYSTIYMNFKCIMLVKNAWFCRHSSKARASKEKTNHWLPNDEERGKKYIKRACVCMLGGTPSLCCGHMIISMCQNS